MLREAISAEASLPKKHVIGSNFPEGYSSMSTSGQLSFLNAHYTYGGFWEGSLELLAQMYSLNKPLGFRRVSPNPPQRVDRL